MSDDELEAFMRRLNPEIEIAPDRVERLIDGVLARVDREAAAPGWRDVLASIVAPLSPRRFAVLAMVAIVLGFALGSGLDGETTDAAQSNFFTSNSFLPVGS